MLTNIFNPNYLNLVSHATALVDVFVIWSSIWKGTALWKSARKSQKVWFIAILLTNTLGVLEIIYLLFFQKKAAKK